VKRWFPTRDVRLIFEYLKCPLADDLATEVAPLEADVDPLAVEVDLGRVVMAKRIVVRFAEGGGTEWMK